jgi:hypothetical protein
MAAKKIRDPLFRLESISDAWSSVRPEAVFFGFALDQYRDGIKPSYDIRADITALKKKLKDAIAKKKDIDAASLLLAKNIVHAVKADPKEGENSTLYATMGFVRTSERAGKGRRRISPAAPKAAGASTVADAPKAPEEGSAG